jgi:hypothetical protein
MPQEAGLTEQATARLSLNRLRGSDVDKAILSGITNQEPNVRVELIRATAERGMSAATETLLQCAKDPDRGVRRAAVRALRGTAGPSNVPALIDLLASLDAGADRQEAVRTTASALRRSPAASLGPVISAYRSTTDDGLRFSLLSVLAQTGRDESLQILRDALKEGRTEIRRSAILALSDWPSTAPIQDLLEIARTDPGPVLPVLALQGYIRLVGLPSDRPSAETLGMLSEAMRLARRSEEKKAVLSLVQRIYSADALAMAEAAAQDPEMAAEAKMAADQIRKRLAPARKRK